MPPIERITNNNYRDSLGVASVVEKVCTERGLLEVMAGDDERGNSVWVFGVGNSDETAEGVTYIGYNNYDRLTNSSERPAQSVLIASRDIIDEVKRVLREDSIKQA